MSLAPLNIPALLRSHGLNPKKGLGQNFLVDSAVLDRIVAGAEIPPEAEVLEIGAGLGSLTRVLALAARHVTAVELDRQLIPMLKEVLRPYPNVTIVEGDILELEPAKLMDAQGYLAVANIPYYITSAIIRHLLDSPVKPGRLVLTMQREVAERICAQPGDMSLLALSVQVYGNPYPVARIPAGAFYPPPTVDSVTLRVDLYPQPAIPTIYLDSFFRLARAGFSQKRKMLRNSLSAGLGWPAQKTAELLQTVQIDPMRRAETLTISEWGRLTEEFEKTKI